MSEFIDAIGVETRIFPVRERILLLYDDALVLVTYGTPVPGDAVADGSTGLVAKLVASVVVGIFGFTRYRKYKVLATRVPELSPGEVASLSTRNRLIGRNDAVRVTLMGGKSGFDLRLVLRDSEIVARWNEEMDPKHRDGEQLADLFRSIFGDRFEYRAVRR
jgi:hypothetical protein